MTTRENNNLVLEKRKKGEGRRIKALTNLIALRDEQKGWFFRRRERKSEYFQKRQAGTLRHGS